MSKPAFIVHDDQWAKELEESYENYIWECEEHIDYDPSDERIAEEPKPTLSGEPFCGCATCYTREQLFFLVPRIIKAYKEGKVTVTEGEAADAK